MSGFWLTRIPMKPLTPASVNSTNMRMIGIGFLIDQDEMFFIVGPYFLAVRDAAALTAAVRAAEARWPTGRAAAATVTRSPSPRKPAPATTTRAPAARPLTAVESVVRDSTVTGWKWARP